MSQVDCDVCGHLSTNVQTYARPGGQINIDALGWGVLSMAVFNQDQQLQATERQLAGISAPR
jgi:hypothetical protein